MLNLKTGKLKVRNFFYFLLIIVLVAVNNNCYEYLTNNQLKAPQILFYRGVFTLILTIIYAHYRNQALMPKEIAAQSVRFITTGGSLLLILFSYNYLSAGTVSLLQRLDIPVLIFFSIFITKRMQKMQTILSILVIAIVLFLAIDPQLIDEDRNGFLLVFCGIAMVAIGYMTVHRGSNRESVPSLINVASVSSIFFGALLMIFYGHTLKVSLINMLLLILSSVINIMLFYLTIERYKVYTPEKALLPFVWAILSTAVIEMLLERSLYSLKEIFVTVGLTLLITIICLIKPNKTLSTISNENI